MKSTVEQIRARFDNDVERFSNLETGQSATIDAPLVLELISQAATATNPASCTRVNIDPFSVSIPSIFDLDVNRSRI